MSVKIKQAWQAGVPLVAVETADPAQTISSILRDLNGKLEDLTLLQWDICRSLVGKNERGKKAVKLLLGDNPVETLCDPTACLNALGKLEGEHAFAFILNGHKHWTDADRLQAIWNLRDEWKAKGSMLVILCESAATLPAELRADVLVMNEDSPDEERIDHIVEEVSKAAKLKLESRERQKVLDTLLGYPCDYAVEQAFALGCSKDGVDIQRLWELRIQAMKTLAGIEISMPQETFADLAGCEGAKAMNGAYITGRTPPRCVFLLDELEKMIAGHGTDSSGVTGHIVEQFLYWTEQKKVDAELLVGVPGAGKTRTGWCTAGEAHVPFIRGSMSMVTGSLVGQSEAQMSRMLKAVDAIGQGRVLMVATCNNMETLPPEIVARFRLGTFFFDYPTETELAALWKYYIRKYDLKDKAPSVSRWVGREVESCCHRAWLFRQPLSEAMKTVVPVSMASAGKMEALRKSASGRFNAAAYVGVYDCDKQTSAPQGRKIGGLEQ